MPAEDVPAPAGEDQQRREDVAAIVRPPFLFSFLTSSSGAGTHSLALHGSPLPAEDVLQLGEMLDERHHLRLEALGVDILHRGHLQKHFNVKPAGQVRVGPAVPARIRAEAGFELHPSTQSLPQVVHLLIDVENKSLPSSCGEAFPVELAVWGKVAQGQAS